MHKSGKRNVFVGKCDGKIKIGRPTRIDERIILKLILTFIVLAFNSVFVSCVRSFLRRTFKSFTGV
jgi:hypothetical protein